MAENTRNEENPNDEDLRIKTTTTTYSNHVRATVRGNIEDVVAFVNKAREAQEIAARDLEKANNWLNKSQELLAEVLAAIGTGDASKETPNVNPDAGPDDEYLRVKRDDTSYNHAGVTVRDLEKAKKWLIKSQLILQTVNARDLLNEVQDAIDAKNAPKETTSVNPDGGPDDDDTNSVVDPNPEQARSLTPTETPLGPTVYKENIEGAKKCLDNANNAFKAKDLNNAERRLLKAKRMDASIVRDARARNTTSRENAVPEKVCETECPKQADIMDEANTYLQLAENACEDQNYERALIFLDKSEALYTSERAATLRKEVKNTMYVANFATCQKNLQNSLLKKKLRAEQAKTYIEVAGKAYYDGDLDKAEILLRKAERLYPTERVKKNLEIVCAAIEEKQRLDSDNI